MLRMGGVLCKREPALILIAKKICITQIRWNCGGRLAQMEPFQANKSQR